MTHTAPPQQWHLYLLRCQDNSLYGGISLEPERRCHEHNQIKGRASRYVWARRPAMLVWQQPVSGKSMALKLEYRLKRLSKKQKEHLLRHPAGWQQWLLKNEDPAITGSSVSTE